MIDPQKDVFARLAADATLVALLATYNSPAAPAIFEDGKAPASVVDALSTKPLVLVTSPANNGNPDSLSASMREEIVSVRLYHKPDGPSGSSTPLQQAAERVRALFKNWGSVAGTGGTIIHAEVSGPFPAPTDDPSLDGRIVSITLLIKES